MLAAEGLLISILQLRTNCLLKQLTRARVRKKDALEKMKEEVRGGTSDIPVVRFEKKNKPETAPEKQEKRKKKGYDAGELAVLQEMMNTFFG